MITKITEFKYDDVGRIFQGEKILIKYLNNTIIVSYDEEKSNYLFNWLEEEQWTRIECRDKVCTYLQNCLTNEYVSMRWLEGEK